MLPGMDGFSVCEEMRTQRALGPGPDAHRAGPGERPDPRARRRRRRLSRQAVRLRRAARAPAGADPPRPVGAPAVLEVGDLRIDPRRAHGHAGRPRGRADACASSPCSISSRAHAGEVVSRTELLEHVWDERPKTGRPTSSTSTSDTCARSWSVRSGAAAHSHRARHRLHAGGQVRLPIRVRLTAWYAALLAAIIVAASGAFLVAAAEVGPRADGRSRGAGRTRCQIAEGYEYEGAEDFQDVSAHGAPARHLRCAGARPRRPRPLRHGEPMRRRRRSRARQLRCTRAAGGRQRIADRAARARRRGPPRPGRSPSGAAASGASSSSRESLHASRRSRRSGARAAPARRPGGARSRPPLGGWWLARKALLPGRADDLEGRGDRHRPAATSASRRPARDRRDRPPRA